MPSEMQQLELAIPLEYIWNFIRDADNWAPLVPGYIHHEKISNQIITLEFKSDLGIMKKKVFLQIEIKEWNEPHRVSFELKRKNDKYLGEGYLEATAINKNKTCVTAFLEINASGAMGTLANSLFKSAKPLSSEEMVEIISSKLEEFKKANQQTR
jgi:carbon monoxide dehydrogenase subunit G